MFRSIYLFILLAIVSCGMTSLHGAEEPVETAIYMISQEDDKVGKNDTFVFDEAFGVLEIKAIKPANTKEIKGFSVIYYNGKGDSWQFKFVIPAKQPMTAGKKYAYAESYPYHTSEKAGIKVCRIFEDFIDLQGEFKILEYSLDPNGKITSLAIDFKQIAGQKGSLYGSIRYRSKISLTTDFEAQGNDGNSIPYTNEYFQHVLELYGTPGYYMNGIGDHFFSKDLPFRTRYWGNILMMDIEGHLDGWYRQLHVWLQAPNKAALEKGVYKGATRTNYNGLNAGLEFHGGPWRIPLGGSFEVLESKYNGSGVLEVLAVDFVYYSADKSTPLRGTLRYNTNIRPSTEAEIRARLE